VKITCFRSGLIIEPKTSPVKTKQQLVYGVLMAFFIAGLAVLKVPNAVVIGLLIGNIGYFVYKKNR